MKNEFHHAVLDNGLTVIAEVNPGAATAAAGFFVRAGGRDESATLMGISHFLEHMVFKGSPRRNSVQVNLDLDHMGADVNANTDSESTEYWVCVLPEHLAAALEVLTDILRPALRQEDFDLEKRVVLEEIAMYEDQPFWRASDQVMEDFYGSHSLSHRILGTRESVGAISVAAMHRYWQDFYGPQGMVLALAGNLDFSRCLKQVRALCGAWVSTPAPAQRPLPQVHAARRTLTDADLAQHYLVGLAPGPSVQDDSRYAAAVLADLIGDATGSRLYWRLVHTGLASSAEMEYQGMDGTGLFSFSAVCDPDQRPAVEETLLDVLDSAGQFQVQEVRRAVGKIALEMALEEEIPLGRMLGLGSQWMALGRYVPLTEELARIQAVGPGDIEVLLRQYPFQPRAIVSLGPG